MHDIKWIRDNVEAFEKALLSRNWEAPKAKQTVADLIELDDHRRNVIGMSQKGQEERNSLSKQIGQAMGKKDMALADALKARVAQLKDDLSAAEAEEKKAVAELERALLELPNLPLAEVPPGKGEHDNVEARVVGAKPTFAEGFKPKEHFEIGEALGLMDFEAATRMSGARFVVLKGGLARLERALGQFMVDLHTDVHGYTEVNPPILVKDDAMYGTAQLPKFRDDQFQIVNAADRLAQQLITKRASHDTRAAGMTELNEIMRFLHDRMVEAGDRGGDVSWSSNVFLEFRDNFEKMATEFKQFQIDFLEISSRVVELEKRGIAESSFWLIPTAEVPLTNLVREQILDEKQLPMRVTALTPCFRAEAGSAGRDTRGMIRQHQFTKVELVSITTPDKSLEEHERMTACAEEVLKRLGLHYRVVTLCTGDMGFASQKTYDIEVWLPGQDRFREISSCSVCGEFQARRMNARYRPAEGKSTRFVHTLNGSGVAVGRALVAVLENYQNADGSVTVPDVLRPYMGGLERIAAK